MADSKSAGRMAVRVRLPLRVPGGSSRVGPLSVTSVASVADVAHLKCGERALCGWLLPSPPGPCALRKGGTCCFMCLCVFGVAVCGGCAFLLGRVACVNGIELRGKRCHVTVLVGRDGGCWYGCACLYWWLAEPHVAIFTRTGFRLLLAVLVGACGAWSATRVCGLRVQGRSSKGWVVPV